MSVPLAQSPLDQIPPDVIDAIPEDVVDQLRDGVIDKIPDEIVDRLPDSIADRIPEGFLENTPEFVWVLLAIGALAVAFFVWSVAKSAWKAAFLAAVLGAGAFAWYFYVG